MVDEDSGTDAGGSAARMDAARSSEVSWGDEYDSESRLGVEDVIDTGGVEEVEDAERWGGCLVYHLWDKTFTVDDMEKGCRFPTDLVQPPSMIIDELISDTQEYTAWGDPLFWALSTESGPGQDQGEPAIGIWR